MKFWLSRKIDEQITEYVNISTNHFLKVFLEHSKEWSK